MVSNGYYYHWIHIRNVNNHYLANINIILSLVKCLVNHRFVIVVVLIHMDTSKAQFTRNMLTSGGVDNFCLLIIDDFIYLRENGKYFQSKFRLVFYTQNLKHII